MKMKQIFFTIALLFGSIQAVLAYENGVDCIILEDENSIICKYSLSRVSYEKKVLFQWIEPDKTITRERELVIPANHGSVYDYRYIEGRTKGIWTFKAVDGQDIYTTNFTIE